MRLRPPHPTPQASARPRRPAHVPETRICIPCTVPVPDHERPETKPPRFLLWIREREQFRTPSVVVKGTESGRRDSNPGHGLGVHGHGLGSCLVSRRADSLLRHQEQRLAGEARRPEGRHGDEGMWLVGSRAIGLGRQHTEVAFVVRAGAATTSTDLPVPDPFLFAVAISHELEVVDESERPEATAVEARKGRLRGTAADLGVDTLASGTILCEWSKHENKQAHDECGETNRLWR
mgnify:CR=1 FL=1